MTKVHEISQQELEEFLDEAPTDPFIKAPVSLIEMSAHAQQLGYETDSRHWTTRLSEQLDEAPIELTENDILTARPEVCACETHFDISLHSTEARAIDQIDSTAMKTDATHSKWGKPLQRWVTLSDGIIKDIYELEEHVVPE